MTQTNRRTLGTWVKLCLGGCGHFLRGLSWNLKLSLGSLLLAALLCLGASGHPWIAERFYARGVYPVLVASLGGLTGHLPFCVLELLLLSVLVLLMWRSARAIGAFRRFEISGGRLALRGAGFLLALGAWIGSMLIFFWGLNLYRVPLGTLLNLPSTGASTDELVALGQELAREASRLRPTVIHGSSKVEWTVDVRPGFQRLQGTMPWLPTHLPMAKAPWLGRTFSYFGAIGVYGAWTAEPMVDGGAPGWYLPSVRAHETAHGAGFVREDEANFLAWSACRAHPDPAIRYSGTLAALQMVRGRLARRQSDRLHEVDRLLVPGCREDINELAKWVEKPKPTAHVAQQVYNQVLKAQGQTQGLASYGLAVDLLLAERRKRLIGMQR